MKRAHGREWGLTAWLVAAALLIRAALPVGWMPMPTHEGMRVMLCSGNGAIELSVPTQRLGDHAAAHEHGGSPAKDAPRDPCAFGMALSKAFDIPVPPVPGPVFRQIVQPSILPTITVRLVAARGLRPPARGPPHFA